VKRALSSWLILTLAVASAAEISPGLSQSDKEFLEDLEQRSVMYFWEQADPRIGLVLDRANVEGGRPKGPGREIASSAATGFGLTALCIGAEHGWIPRDQAKQRARIALEFFASKAYHQHGWFYHWMEVSSGESRWDSELSTIDTALFLAGALTAGQCFADDPEIPKLAKQIYDRVDFMWMLQGDSNVLSHGWIPDRGFIAYQWDTYSEASILYLLGIGSMTHPLPPASWYAWRRPFYTYGPYSFISGGPLFTHQYSMAWVDFRNRRDRGLVDYYQNSIAATRANRLYCQNLQSAYPSSFFGDIWGITASDGPKGYRIYSEIQNFQPVDGTVAPCAAAGSLMLTPDISLVALRAIKERYGDAVYGRYGFVDGYNPTAKWFDSDVIGIDVGITLLSAENLLTGNVWKWFMAEGAVARGMDLAGFTRPPAPEPSVKPAAKPAPAKKPPVRKKKTPAPAAPAPAK
jgi:hypothetical protein